MDSNLNVSLNSFKEIPPTPTPQPAPAEPAACPPNPDPVKPETPTTPPPSVFEKPYCPPNPEPNTEIIQANADDVDILNTIQEELENEPTMTPDEWYAKYHKEEPAPAPSCPDPNPEPLERKEEAPKPAPVQEEAPKPASVQEAAPAQEQNAGDIMDDSFAKLRADEHRA